VTGTASFREMLQVNAFSFLFLSWYLAFWPLFSLLFLIFLLLLLHVKAFSQDYSSFFGSGEVEKKLVFKVNRLKAELASKQVELEAECQGHQITEEALCAQVGELE
jgi:hypothetical protein